MSIRRILALMISIFLLGAVLHTTESFAAFSDVPSGHPFSNAINYVQQQGIVSGYPDGTFQPDRILNRAEFTKIIIESRYDENTINSCLNRGGFYEQAIFKDVEPGVWFEKYVCVAKREGIIQGYSDGTFRPIQTIIFAEAAKIAAESYGLRVGGGDPWFEPYLTKLASLNAVPNTLAGIPDLVQRGVKEISRGEMADVIFRMKEVQNNVVSDDGNFQISVPETALPRGLTAKDIKISRLSETEGGLKEVNGAPMVFYKLEPDGTQFSEPVRFTIETETVANTVPMVFLVSGDSFDLIPEPVIEIDQKLMKAKLTAQISHFSEVAIGFADYFDVSKVTLTPAGTQAANTTFQAKVDIQKTTAPPSFVLQSNNQTINISNNWKLENLFFENTPGALSPFFVRGNTINKQTNVNNYSSSVNFSCSPSGADQTIIEYEGMITWNYTFQSQSRSTTSVIRSTSDPFRCEGVDPMAAQYQQWSQFAFENINQLRAENGKAPLKRNTLLDNIASIHAEDMALNIGDLSHQGSLGEESFERIKEGKVINLATNTYQTVPFPANIDRSGENVGRRNINLFNGSGEDAILDQHNWFMSTPDTGVTHRTTMLSTNINFTEVGIGLYLDGEGNLWIVENFISF